MTARYTILKSLFLITLILVNFLFFNFSLVFAADGELDLTFDPQDGANGTVQAIAVQEDGKIVIGGDFTSYNGTSINRIARLNSDGSLDNTFDPGTGLDDVINDIAIQDNGKILIVGQFTDLDGNTVGKIARLNSDGSIDTNFNSGGTGANLVINDILLLDDGDMYITGNFSIYNSVSGAGRIIRLNSDGTEDTGFNNGTGLPAAGSALALQSDGKIIVGGNFSSYNGSTVYRLARINTDGTLDNTFNTGNGPSGLVSTIAIQDDGKVLIAGSFTDFDGTTVGRIARLSGTDGSLDNTFNSGGAGANLAVTKLLVQENGKILMIGNFSAYNGDTSIGRIARLNSDGSIDTTFRPAPAGAGASGTIETITLQGNGQILIGGAFTAYDSVSRIKVARLEGDHVPVTVSLTPEDDSTGVAVGVNLVLEFDELVNIGTGNITIKKTSDDTTVETIDVTGLLVTGDGTDTITVNPSGLLDTNTGYYILIDQGAFEDADGNEYPGIESTITWNFTTTTVSDTTDPTVSTFSPSDDSVDVAINSNLVITFDEAVNVGTGNITIKKTSDDTTVETIDVTGLLVTGGGTNTITVNPSNDLLNDTDYYVVIDATAFDDLSGNSYAGVSNSTTWNFKTVAIAVVQGVQNKSGSIVRSSVNSEVPKNILDEASSILEDAKCPVFTTYWEVGDSGSGVGQIQAFLAEQGFFNYRITSFYGPITDKAVRDFQNNYSSEVLTPWGLTSPTGRWYQSTRHKANELVGCSEQCIFLDNGVQICD